MKQSAGVLPYRLRDGVLEVYLVHPGGPFWAKKDDGAWSISKGEFEPPEDAVDAALREFQEETGERVDGQMTALTPIKVKSGKVLHIFATATNDLPETIISNTFEMEWPPRSGKRATFPEVDRAGWFDVETAVRKLSAGQDAIVLELQRRLA